MKEWHSFGSGGSQAFDDQHQHDPSMAAKGIVHILVCAFLESMDMVANVFIFSTSTSRKVIFLSSSYPC